MACFFPSSAPAANYTPCNAAAGAASCCPPSDICLDNGYCLGTSGATPNALYRGACTDPRWLAPACPAQCRTVNAHAADALVIFHVAADGTPSTFCCSGGYDSVAQVCRDSTPGGNVPFEMANGRAIGNRSDGSVGWGTATAAAATVTATTTVTATPTGTASSAAVAAVGAGVGVPLAALGLAACVFALWERRRRARMQALLADQHATMLVALEAQGRTRAMRSVSSELCEMPDKPVLAELGA